MWPWGHLAVGYLIYSSASQYWRDSPPSAFSVFALAIGTQFPDIIDKPLAWTLGILPNGRSLAHALLTAIIILAVLRLVARRHHQHLVTAFGIGYLSHLFADGFQPMLAGDISALRYLAWPFVPAIEYSTDKSFLAHFQSLELTMAIAVELGLVLLALSLWVYDGAPGFTKAIQISRGLYRKFLATL